MRDASSAPLSRRDAVSAPLSLREATPLSLRNAVPLSLRDSAPLSRRDAASSAPLSLRDTSSAPLSLRDTAAAAAAAAAAPLSLRAASPVPLSRRDAAPAPPLLARRADAGPAPNALYVRSGVQVSSDHVLRYLRSRNLISWIPSGAGFHVDIAAPLWELGLAGAARRKRSYAPMPAKRAIRLVDVDTAAVGRSSVACYAQEVSVSAKRLQQVAEDACKALAEPMVGDVEFRMWEVKVDVEGERGGASHLRVGVQVLGGGGLGGDVAACRATLAAVGEACGAGSGSVASGDVLVDGRFLLSVDPVRVLY
ncbi:Cytokinesis protein cyk3 [Lasiodiplodia theobromae]|uniref:Uncharacterized protein n=1 Tax=Lasiodiplodia theobromae TaxID=45133 RepID=A0A5N5D2H9_9PEZI|nr:Cytokinesis protein cyk3 [Lasiodiplodia theobromae]KAB2571856.1 hypothetical protein DBV05_g9504 [Lasiodiplodia theobromae]KAF4539602.1 Cytokinesis protein cyk3 [Lasiodiplodia theobromae]